MIKKTTYFILAFCLSLPAFAQKADGTIRSLINTEDFFNLLVKKEGIQKGFLKFADAKGIVFRPGPVDMKKYYTKNNEADYQISWKPEYARISKEGDLAFTTGPYELVSAKDTTYGHYLSIWKNDRNKWKLWLDVGITHAKPPSVLKYEYYDPSNYKYPKLLGPQKIQMREDIVFNTDILLGKALKLSGSKNFKEFYDPKVRLYFPEYLPVIGKLKALDFIDKKELNIVSNPITAERAISGDLAYTYGDASINQENYHYVRVWKLDEDMKWNIILDVYSK
jgi:hypothetical protein